jgi:hypothetical protein
MTATLDHTLTAFTHLAPVLAVATLMVVSACLAFRSER